MGWFLPLLRPVGLTARMTAGQMADSNIELGRIFSERELGPVLDSITVPVRYVVASSHGAVLRRDFRAVAEAVREAAALDHADRWRT